MNVDAKKPIGEFISAAAIDKRVRELAQLINTDFKNEEVIMVCVLNGSFIFCADLVRHLNVPAQVEFVSLSSYEGTQSSGEVSFRMDVKQSLVGKNVIVVEDIVDTGLTISFLLKHMKLKQLKSLKLCSLLLKRARLKTEVAIDYLGFDIEDKFVIGYGLDFDGHYRELPFIGVYGE
jgi:hypoxanthine phosphoribosyltransferase